jgi:hypothetical protein
MYTFITEVWKSGLEMRAKGCLEFSSQRLEFVQWTVMQDSWLQAIGMCILPWLCEIYRGVLSVLYCEPKREGSTKIVSRCFMFSSIKRTGAYFYSSYTSS